MTRTRVMKKKPWRVRPKTKTERAVLKSIAQEITKRRTRLLPCFITADIAKPLKTWKKNISYKKELNDLHKLSNSLVLPLTKCSCHTHLLNIPLTATFFGQLTCYGSYVWKFNLLICMFPSSLSKCFILEMCTNVIFFLWCTEKVQNTRQLDIVCTNTYKY